ncbi:MAG TPA: hypothetical protein EYG34_07550 [Acidimicrobiia bacterium]|jgi:hypothetical protein|nr:hypothetical protein [Acidimicrobiia bacterium]HIL46952.1 hypothetical protein [Acidimicrobiia bacterium]
MGSLVVAFLTYSEMVILVILFGLFVAVFSVTFFALQRSAKEKQWKWFAVVLVSWILGVGWVFSLIYLLGPGRKPRWSMIYWGEQTGGSRDVF